MKAVIMAGGEGSRLRPITCTIPKPLVPVNGIPAIERIIGLCAEYGITEAAVTTMYLGDKLRERCGSEYGGVKLYYYNEDTPLGTAGSIGACRDFLCGDKNDPCESFIVLSGDAVCDFNLKNAMSFHIMKKADVTILSTSTSKPLEYGLILTDTDGRITGFSEKPSWEGVSSNMINTGIYIISNRILDEIPRDRGYDFGRELFPSLLSRGFRLFSYGAAGYWCDIGSVDDYYRCNFEIASSTDNIIGENCRVDETATVSASILFDGVTIGAGAVVDHAILCEAVTVGSGSIIRQGCVIGADSVIENEASIQSGVKIWNDKRIRRQTTVAKSLIWGEARDERELFCDGGITGKTGEIDPVYCIRLGQAVASASAIALKASKNAGYAKAAPSVGVMTAGDSVSRLLGTTLLCGIAYGGAVPMDFGVGFKALAAYGAIKYSSDIALFVSRESSELIRIEMFDCCGLYPTRIFERALMSSMTSDSSKPADKSGVEINNVERISGVDSLYSSELTGECGRLDGIGVSLGASEPERLLAGVLRRRGANISEDAALKIRIDGYDLKITENSESYSYDGDLWHIAAILEAFDREAVSRRPVALPCYAPPILERIAHDRKLEVRKYSSCPCDDGENETRRLAASQLWIRDPCYAVVKVLSCAADGNTTVSSLASQIPKFHSLRTTYELDDSDGISCGEAKTLVLSSLGKPDIEGVKLDWGNSGQVRIVAGKNRELKMYIDSRSAEAAKEIFELSKSQIEALIKKNHKN